ncbi:MAG: hypothetical protein M1812_005185 [Candelaria pacifica]|nr:MAG: hypothetical protein M1812_005185 [Candelaria pacifica]
MPDYRRRPQPSSMDYDGWYRKENTNAKAPPSNTDSGYYSVTDSYHNSPSSPDRDNSSHDAFERTKWMSSVSRKARRWPPRPFAEDELTSLAKELGGTTLSESSFSTTGDVLVRGTIDQLPIILEADSSVLPPAPYTVEPSLPANDNPERRFVFIPTHEEHALDNDNKVPKERANEGDIARRRKEHPRLDTLPKPVAALNGLAEKKPSPYAIKGDRLSGEYVMSPGILTPAKEYPTGSTRRNGSFSSHDRSKSSFEGSEVDVKDSASQHGKSRSRRHSFRKQETPRTSLESSRSDYDEDSKLQEYLLRQAFQRNPPTQSLKSDKYPPNVAPRSRPSSRHASPTASPLSSPPHSPRLEPTSYYNTPPPNGGARSRRISRTGPRPASPLSTRHPYPPHSSRHDTVNDDYPRDHTYGDGRRSRSTSPLPSPTYERADPYSAPRIDIKSPSPLPHQSRISQVQPNPNLRRPSPSLQAKNPPYPDGPHYRMSLGPELPPRSPSAFHIDTNSRSLAGQPNTPRSAPFAVSDRKQERRPSNEPTARSPSYTHHGSQNRQHAHTLHAPPVLPSRTTETPAPRLQHTSPVPKKVDTELPPCPRSKYVKGYDDWSTLSGVPSFDICPVCVQAVMSLSQYRQYFVRSPPRDPATSFRCDFSSPWVRHAWALTLKQRRPNLDLVYGVAEVETTEVPCPGYAAAVAPWSHLIDPNTGRPVPNFDLCPYCVRNVEASMPSLRGAFVRTYLPDPTMPRVCDFRSDSRRFPSYVALLEGASTKAEIERKPADLRAFADHARTRASLRQCPRDDMVLGQQWHIVPQIPQFTVCEECYHDVIWPAVTKGSHLAGKFNRTLQHVGAPNHGVSCQLYSPRMRWIFGQAADKNDLEGLRAVVLERVGMEAILQGRHRELQGMLAMHTSIHGHSSHGEREKEAIIDEIAHIAGEWKRWE